MTFESPRILAGTGGTTRKASPDMPQARPAVERFQEKYSVNPDTGCWEWTACLHDGGYGLLNVGGRMVRAHRFSYELHVGPIPDGLVLDHLCRNRACCNPEHLNPCTRGENLHAPDSESPAAVYKARTHCKHGHEYTDDTIYWHRGARYCKVCLRNRKREARRQKRETPPAH